MPAKRVICPRTDCGKQIVETELEWHLKNGHNDHFEDRWNYDYDNLDSDEIDFLQENMDATKDIGYPCREDGRYGSYSSHDGYDDESEA